jgi:hypothetical protein
MNLKQHFVVVLCWIVMVGNVMNWMFGVALIAERTPLSSYGAGIGVVAFLSFGCALILRRATVQSIRRTRIAKDSDQRRNADPNESTHAT